MKATTKEEAERAWAEKSDIHNVPDHPYSEGFLDAIDLFKSALRAEIEYEISQLIPISDLRSGKRLGLRNALDLLETTLPPKE